MFEVYSQKNLTGNHHIPVARMLLFLTKHMRAIAKKLRIRKRTQCVCAILIITKMHRVKKKLRSKYLL